MSIETENLWGDIPLDVTMETPLGILRSQANILKKVSGGLLDGRVKQFDVAADSSNKVGHELLVVVPALGNYSVPVVSVIHPVSLYPAKVYADLTKKSENAGDSTELKERLTQVLQSKEVRNLVIALIAQANDSGSSSKMRSKEQGSDEN